MTLATGLTRDRRELGRFAGNVGEVGRLMFSTAPGDRCLESMNRQIHA